MTIWKPELQWADYPDTPKYLALAACIDQAIQAGALQPGEKLPTHRKLADWLGVTVGTVTRGYAEAERKQLVVSRVGSGTYVRAASASQSSMHQSFTLSEPVDASILDMSYSIVVESDQVTRCASTLAEIQSDPVLLRELLDYHPENGMLHHREAGAQWLRDCGFTQVSADQVLVTTGAQHGFFNVLMGLMRPGEVILSEGLTYPGFIAATRQLNLKLVGVGADADGLIPSEFEVACHRHRPRMVYVMTRMSNPTCHHYSEARIHAIAQLCRENNLLILEDDVQGAMGPADRPSFYELYPAQTILVSSISKVLAGGLRVGYVACSEGVRPAIAAALRTSNWITPPLPVEIASRWIQQGAHTEMRDRQNQVLQRRHRRVCAALPGLVQQDAYGLNVWLVLPPPWRASQFAEQAEQRGVLVKTSEVFAAGQYSAPQGIRFCLGGRLSDAAVDKALDILQEILSEQPSQEFAI